jgi:ketosteroid isomerase-like protein
MTIKETVLNYFRIVDARQFDELDQVFHAEMVYERPGYKMLEGIGSIIKFYKQKRRILSGNHTIEGLIAEGDICTCWGRFVGKSRKDQEIDERFADVFIFEDGKIKKRITYFHRKAV